MVAGKRPTSTWQASHTYRSVILPLVVFLPLFWRFLQVCCRTKKKTLRFVCSFGAQRYSCVIRLTSCKYHLSPSTFPTLLSVPRTFSLDRSTLAAPGQRVQVRRSYARDRVWRIAPALHHPRCNARLSGMCMCACVCACVCVRAYVCVCTRPYMHCG